MTQETLLRQLPASMALVEEVVAKMSILKIKDSQGNWVGVPSIKGDKGDTGPQGPKGDSGTDGISPTVSITPITGGHRITITDKDGEHSADVMDGTGNVDDVQINGTSIVDENGVANVPIAGSEQLGAVCVSHNYGIDINYGGRINIVAPTTAIVKDGTNLYKPITPKFQHASAFYGLAKAAGDTTQSQSSNAVGNYTDAAKGKIQAMLGIADLIGNSEGATASQAYSVGDVFLHKGKLYKATASIAQGSAIVPNTNCSQTTIIDLLRGV